jgi:NarL family two-component system response regulator YdfI
MTSAIRVLIADDHLIVREGLRMILGEAADFEVVGEAEDGLQAIELAGQTQPDVILMDLRMPGLDGLTAIAKIKAQLPEIAIVILTTYNEDELMVRGLQGGAQGFLLKDTDRETLFNTIRAAFRGDTLLQANTLARILPRIETATSPAARPHQADSSGGRFHTILSQRELEILKLVANGARNKEVANQLNISQSTVKAHLDSIFNKLGVDSRTAAVSIALQYGLLSK